MDTFLELLPGVLLMVAPVMPPILGALFGAVADRMPQSRGPSPRSHPARSNVDSRSIQTGRINRQPARESGTSHTQPVL